MTLKDLRRQKQLEKFVQRLGLLESAPIKWDLLDLALTHPTISATENYDQLEFLGDAVVRMAASELLLELYPECSVGEFSAIRKVLVSDRILAIIADDYGLDRYLLISDSAAADKAGQNSRLADAFEAVLAALYLSTKNLELVRSWLDPHFERLADEVRQDPARQNYKDALQAWTQSRFQMLPQYRVVETGEGLNSPERFTAEVWFQNRRLGQGKGRSKKAAEQVAAKEAFLTLVNS